MSGKTYCVLGGGGSFGINCALYLLEHAHPEKVVGIGRGALRPTPFSLGVEKHQRYEYRQFHIGYEYDLLIEYLYDLEPDVIINFAAQGEGAVSWKHSWRFFDTNATALARLYEALGNLNCHFIQIGTSELYGSVTAPAAEGAPIKPTSPYAASKAAFDMYLLSMVNRGVPMNILRPSNCYCPGQLLHRIVPRAIVSGLLGRKVPLHGGGGVAKSYLHASDLSRAIHMISERDDLYGRVFNVGPENPTLIRGVATMCAEAIGKTLDQVFDVAPERPGQDACYWLDSSAIRALGWAPQIEWKQGLDSMVSWAKTYLDDLAGCTTDYQLRA